MIKAAVALALLGISILFLGEQADGTSDAGESHMIDIQETSRRIKDHLKALTVEIGERSVAKPENLERTAVYIETFYKDLGLAVQRQPYTYHHLQVANVIAEVSFAPSPRYRYLVGAHYDSVAGTVGADDNASAVAVQLETARQLSALAGGVPLDLSVAFVSFALEEPPAYGTRFMGSRVYARNARKQQQNIDGMICLEMVGYTCQQPGCQAYPFPLMFFGYPKEGNFIGIVGNGKSRKLTKQLFGQFSKNPQLPVVKLQVPLNGWILPSVRLSDHASFWDQGFQAVMITDSAFYRNPHYHQASDTLEKLDYRFMAELVQSLILFFRSKKGSHLKY